jgi:tRNA pseudouridine32 synthase / 23S rRNA pseudouridine746 synthase
MATSGLVVMARGIEPSAAEPGVRKAPRAQALHRGGGRERFVNPLPDNGWNTIDLPLIVDWLARPRSKVDHEIGKPSLTRWRLAPDPSPRRTRRGWNWSR